MPQKYIPPKYKYPYILEVCPQFLKHAQQRIVHGKHKIEQTSSLQDFCLRLIIPPPPPPESKYGPENKYLHHR